MCASARPPAPQSPRPSNAARSPTPRRQSRLRQHGSPDRPAVIPKCLAMPEDQIQQIAVRHFDALGLAGGSRRVDDVGQFVSRYCNGLQPNDSQRLIARGGCVEIDGACLPFPAASPAREPREMTSGSLGIVQDRTQTRGRPGGVQWKIRRTGTRIASAETMKSKERSRHRATGTSGPAPSVDQIACQTLSLSRQIAEGHCVRAGRKRDGLRA